MLWLLLFDVLDGIGNGGGGGGGGDSDSDLTFCSPVLTRLALANTLSSSESIFKKVADTGDAGAGV